MDPVAAKFIGAGLACIGMAGAAMGVGNVAGFFLYPAWYEDAGGRGFKTYTS